MRILIAIGIIMLSGLLGRTCEAAAIGIPPATYWLLGALTGMLAIGIIAGDH